MNEIVKVCKVHGELTRHNCISTWFKKNNKYFYLCKFCKRIARNKWGLKNRDELKNKYKIWWKNYYKENKEKFSIKNKNNYSKNKEKYKITVKKWQIENSEKINNRKKNKYIEEKESVTDSYVRSQIYWKFKVKKNNTKLFSYEFIDLYRQHILFKRKLKEIKNGSKEHRAAT